MVPLSDHTLYELVIERLQQAAQAEDNFDRENSTDMAVEAEVQNFDRENSTGLTVEAEEGPPAKNVTLLSFPVYFLLYNSSSVNSSLSSFFLPNLLKKKTKKEGGRGGGGQDPLWLGGILTIDGMRIADHLSTSKSCQFDYTIVEIRPRSDIDCRV